MRFSLKQRLSLEPHFFAQGGPSTAPGGLLSSGIGNRFSLCGFIGRSGDTGTPGKGCFTHCCTPSASPGHSVGSVRSPCTEVGPRLYHHLPSKQDHFFQGPRPAPTARWSTSPLPVHGMAPSPSRDSNRPARSWLPSLLQGSRVPLGLSWSLRSTAPSFPCAPSPGPMLLVPPAWMRKMVR